MLRAWLLLGVACGSSPPPSVANTAPPAPVSSDCARLAGVLARVPGPNDCCGVEGRRQIFGRHCTEHAWPSSVMVCAEPDSHDPLACPYASGLDDKQQAAFSALFERLHGGDCPADCT